MFSTILTGLKALLGKTRYESYELSKNTSFEVNIYDNQCIDKYVKRLGILYK